MAAREWAVDMGGGGGTFLRDLLDDLRCISGVNGAANVPPAGKGGVVEAVSFVKAAVKASRRLDFDDEAVFGREGGRDLEAGAVFDDEVAGSATFGGIGSADGSFEGDEGVRRRVLLFAMLSLPSIPLLPFAMPFSFSLRPSPVVVELGDGGTTMTLGLTSCSDPLG